MSRFIVVSGLPASGKSTIGAALSTGLGLPLLDKDDILEALFDELGVGDAAWRTTLSRAADRILETLAERSRAAVVVSWWRLVRAVGHVAAVVDVVAARAGRGALPLRRRSGRGTLLRPQAACRPSGCLEGPKPRTGPVRAGRVSGATGARALHRGRYERRLGCGRPDAAAAGDLAVIGGRRRHHSTMGGGNSLAGDPRRGGVSRPRRLTSGRCPAAPLSHSSVRTPGRFRRLSGRRRRA